MLAMMNDEKKNVGGNYFNIPKKQQEYFKLKNEENNLAKNIAKNILNDLYRDKNK